MHARISRLQFPVERLEEAIRSFREETAPAVRRLDGNIGAVLLLDRETGDAAAVTQWETGEALAASEQAAEGLRSSAAESAGGRIVEVTRLENVIMERTGPPVEGSFVRVLRGRTAPDKLDGLVDAVRSQAVPNLREMSGFLAMLMGVDRASSSFVISSIFASAEDREGSFGKLQELRDRTFGQAGVEGLEVLRYESAVVQMPVPSATG